VTGIKDRDEKKACMENIPQDRVHGLFDKTSMIGKKKDSQKIKDLSGFFPGKPLVREELAFDYVNQKSQTSYPQSNSKQVKYNLQ